MNKTEQQQRAMNCIYGALGGDAIGAHVEFNKAPVSDKLVKDAVSMDKSTYKGTHGTARGQITDDGEQALGLLRSLSRHQAYIVSDAMRELKAWYKSSPFDMGGTTSKALSLSNSLSYFDHYAEVRELNKSSQANGALMRQAPLVAYCAMYETLENSLTIASTDASITHPHEACRIASMVYMALGWRLINSPPEVFADPSGSHYLLAVSRFLYDVINEVASRLAGDNEYIAELRAIAKRAMEGHLPTCDDWKQGYWGVALQCTFYAFLKGGRGLSYETIIAEIISKGGDTDTNACIAGGLLAIHRPMSQELRNHVDNCDVTKGRNRPKEWQTKGNLKGYIEDLMNA